ncbi:MAG TPA: ADP-ribosylglycohydrolase family protein [Tepidisphaeraceae bacterium]|jgi:ADP-ribosylglycohydrolase
MSTPAAVHGALLGTIVGDAIGLPYEALSRRRGQRLLGPPDRHRFVFGRGMMSDDGEHACMVAQALCTSAGDVEAFRRALARRLRWWLLGLPAGVGGATLRATLKLWLGFPPRHSGVFSAGNGPAMRAPVLGAALRDPERLRQMVGASTRLTHTDPKAFYGATAVAIAAQCSRDEVLTGAAYLDRVTAALPEPDATELVERLSRTVQSVESGECTVEFAAALGARRGVSGYIYETVPVAIHAWLRHPRDYRSAVRAAVECGGDTDTVAAITGGIVASGTGPDGIPAEWRRGLLEWPRSETWIAQLAERAHSAVESGTPAAPPRVGPQVLIRNAFFLSVVLAHVLRRGLPPY